MAQISTYAGTQTHARPSAMRRVLGRDWLLIPRAGALLAFLHAPLPMASLAAGITVALLALPPAKARRKRAKSAGRHRLGA